MSGTAVKGKKPRAKKAEVTIITAPTPKENPIPTSSANNMGITGTVFLGEMKLTDGYHQTLVTKDGLELLTTADGVAPEGLALRCLWLRSGFTWEIVQVNGYTVLIPRIKG